ncbi:MAG: ABC transporter permease, partial [Lachnospiraceae bacterium]|nr:ABC transporter permease [Lachnospiraceae bacterium]
MNSAKKFDIMRTLFSVLIALGISFLLIFMMSEEPVEAIKTLLLGPLSSKRNMGNVIESMIPLIFTGTGVCIMFSANQINLSGEGAFQIGGLAAACVAIYFTKDILSPVSALIFAGLAGALFSVIPAILKITTTASEMVSSLMINYLALYFGIYMLNNVIADPKANMASYELCEA